MIGNQIPDRAGISLLTSAFQDGITADNWRFVARLNQRLKTPMVRHNPVSRRIRKPIGKNDYDRCDNKKGPDANLASGPFNLYLMFLRRCNSWLTRRLATLLKALATGSCSQFRCWFSSDRCHWFCWFRGGNWCKLRCLHGHHCFCFKRNFNRIIVSVWTNSNSFLFSTVACFSSDFMYLLLKGLGHKTGFSWKSGVLKLVLVIIGPVSSKSIGFSFALSDNWPS